MESTDGTESGRLSLLVKTITGRSHLPNLILSTLNSVVYKLLHIVKYDLLKCSQFIIFFLSSEFKDVLLFADDILWSMSYGN